MDRDDLTSPHRKRQLGAIVAHQAEGRRQLDRLAEKRGASKRSLSPGSGLAKIDEEITGVNHQLSELRKEIRQKQPSQPEIHVHVSKPDSDPPSSDGAGLSLEAPFGWHMRARGRLAWFIGGVLGLVAVLVALGWAMGRPSAPRHDRPAEQHAK